MRIAYSVATNFGGSGIGTTSYYAVKGIYDHGNLAKVFCSSYKLRDIPKEYLKSTNSSFLEGIRLVPSAYQWLVKDNYHDLMVSFQSQRCDIFHGWNGHSLFSLRSFRKKGAKIVVERASSHPLTQVEILKKELSKRGIKSDQMLPINMKKLLKEFEEADFITTPSEFAYQSMVEHGVEKNKLALLPFGVDLEKFKPNKISHSTFEALFVGQVGFRKGILYLLEAWENLNLKDAKLTIVGQVDADIKPFLEKYYANKSIQFLGFSPTLPLYQKSDVFIFPSLEEGSALVTYEAMACGLSLITTPNSGSIIEDDKEGYLVKPGDSNELAEKIGAVYKSKDKLETLRRNALSKIQQYSWQNYGDRLNQFYEKIIKGS